MDLVSIIIPVYNAEQFLEETIISAMKQDYPRKEIIVVDDGSNDQSISIAKKFEPNGIIVITQKNKGASAARNRGLNTSKGKYIQFLDADDSLSADKISNQIKLLADNPLKLAVCSTVHFYEDENRFEKKPDAYEEGFLFSTENTADFLIKLWGGITGKGSMIQPNSWLIPRQLIEKGGTWNENISLDDDGEFFCRMILASEGIIKDFVSKNYYRKFRNRDSLSKPISEKSLQSLYLSFVQKKEALLGCEDSTDARKAIANQFQNLSILTYRKYPEIYKKSLKEIASLRVKPSSTPSIGGPFIQAISSIFGWQFAKNLSILKSKLFG